MGFPERGRSDWLPREQHLLAGVDSQSRSGHPTQPNLSTLINVGSGIETTIYDLAYLIKEIIKYDGELKFDVSMPDGTPRKLLDSSKILSLGWKARITLKDGIESTYNWFLNNQDFLRN